MKLRLGVPLPVAHTNPRFDASSWETTGTVEDVVVVAQEADRLGYDWVAVSEHTAIPTDATGARGPRYWDPVATLAHVAALTRRVGLLGHVVVLGYHHPLQIIKAWGTLDVISRGRVILGVGVGSLQPEFELLGRPFDGRGERADDALRAIRASWGDPTPTYRGSHFSYSGFVVDPCGVPRHLDIWVGGRTRRSLRRALAQGDGWIPFRLQGPEVAAMFADPEIRALCEARSTPLEVVLAPEPPLDPCAHPSATAETLGAMVGAGATGFSLRFVNRSRAHFLEQLAALHAVVQGL